MVSPEGKVVVEAAEVRIGEVETEELANPRVQDIHKLWKVVVTSIINKSEA